ncbi:Site-specific recombinase XerD [Vibrio crassostreae]|uniref:tyrosine-type recombinase/integrase n=1 Tax=Vibrio crassostreae TaxID=246167 RepID=UPI00104E674C|nr:site-specific integrase [Vibrio crassostreae]CAK2437378.1 Site-specific recombinase XerD [Vibrio crassostreae]CAK2453746.1 Site-specific recombinase XerD [Vibrio crassostreae]CAK3701660.1 Site-specific recombinase XerD [Vibrio crassostreae]CAK3949954.1 Site-specific recombinase XerD [Vibrio crassostreae]
MSTKRQIRIHLSTAVKRDIKKLKASNRRKSTMDGYVSCNNRILNCFEDKLLKDITAADIDKFANESLRKAKHSKGAGYSDKTIRETLVRLEQIIDSYRRSGEIRNNPFDIKIKLEKGSNAEKTVPYSSQEIQAVKNVADGSGIVEALDCMAETGLRGSELIALTEDNFDIRNTTLSVKKSVVRGECNPPKTLYSERTIAVTTDSMNQITQQLKAASKVCDINLRQGADQPRHLQERFIFFNPETGEGWKDIKELSRAIQPFFHKAGVPFRGLSILRHTFATEMRKRGFDYSEIAEVLGHTSEVITKSIYAFQDGIVRGQNSTKVRNENPLY